MEKAAEIGGPVMKMAIAWVGMSVSHALSGLTLSSLALTVTTLYSAMQMYVLFRDKILRRGK